MIVFHGSSVEVQSPDVYHSRENVDFGKGFYITPIKAQAVKWAARFKRHKGKGVANDKVFNTIELYLEGLIEKAEAIKRLQYDKPNLQMCIRNQQLIDEFLQFTESEEI